MTYVINQMLKEFFIRAIVITFILNGFINNNIYAFLVSGLIIATYYGWNNDAIWEPTKKHLSQSVIYRAHQLWVYVLCGFVGSLSLYLLSSKIATHSTDTFITVLDTKDFVLITLGLLSYAGLLPRTIWNLYSKSFDKS